MYGPNHFSINPPKIFFLILSLLFVTSSCALFVSGGQIPNTGKKSNNSDSGKYSPDTDMWVSAYLGAWNHYAPPGGNWGNLPTDGIDWDAFTHLFYFALNANRDGSLTEIKKYNTFSPSRVNAIVKAAHKNKTAVLFTVGGWGNYPGFRSAIMPENRNNFIKNLLSTLDKWGFDGIDVDMEPIKDETDVKNYSTFIKELHKKLQSRTTPLGFPPLLTAATDWKPNMFSQLQDKFNQINLMTYDMSGAWYKWVSWHNSPVYDGGYKFPGTHKTVPSANGEVDEFLNAGIAKKKLGIGIDFYGYVWDGFVTGPRQKWGIHKPAVKPNVPYFKIMNDYFEQDYYRWDKVAKAAYLSIDNLLPIKKKFISYDNQHSIDAKMKYVRNKNIGGLIIWELSGGYRKNQPKGKRDLLLQEVKKKLHQKSKKLP